MFETVAIVNNQTREYVITLPTFENYTIRLSVTNNKGLSTHTLREIEVKAFDSEVKPPKGEWTMDEMGYMYSILEMELLLLLLFS